MIVCGLDSAGKTAAVALLQEGNVLCEVFSDCGLTHSETLLPLLDKALQQAGKTPAAVDLWGVCAGPGSFTGLRIGLATVKGLSFASNAPCAGVSTLEALAWGACPGEGTVLAALDARRNEVYWAAFALGDTPQRLTADCATPVADLQNFVETCKKPLFFVGDGAYLCYTKYSALCGVVPAPKKARLCNGVAVCKAALAMQMRGECTTPAALLPRYLRLSQAERERAAKQPSPC